MARDVDKLLGDDRKACLLIDESGFAKQGRGSVGVSRQWLGRLGKVDIHSDLHVYLENRQPYLPEKTNNRGPPFEKCLFWARMPRYLKR